MPTLQDYIDAAPTIMALGEFTVIQVENKLASIPDPPSPGTPAPVTKQIVIDIFNQLFARQDVDTALKAANGYGNLGKQHGITKQQAKTVVEELRAMHAVYVAAQGE
jgi:hypothetical protein